MSDDGKARKMVEAKAGPSRLALLLAGATALGALLMLTGERLFGSLLLARIGSYAALAAGLGYLALRFYQRQRARGREEL